MPNRFLTLLFTTLFFLVGVELRGEEKDRVWRFQNGRPFLTGKFVEFRKSGKFIAVKGSGGVSEFPIDGLSDDDLKFLELKRNPPPPPPPPSSAPVPADTPVAADALVQLYWKRGERQVVTSGIVFHVDGDQAFIYDMDGLGQDSQAVEAVVPRRSPTHRTKLKFYHGIGLMFGNSGGSYSILVGPRDQLPEPIKLPGTAGDPVVNRKLLFVSDSRPLSDAGEQTIRRGLMPGITVSRGLQGEEPGGLINPDHINWGSIRFSSTQGNQTGLAFDDSGALLYLIDNRGGEKTPGVRQYPLTPIDFLSCLKIGGFVGSRVEETSDADGKPQIKVDIAIAPLPGAAKKLIVKAIELPAEGVADKHFKALYKSFDSASPPKMVEVGELRRSDVDAGGLRRGSGTLGLPPGKPDVFSLSFAAPQAYRSGQPVVMFIYRRSDAGQDELCRSLRLLAVPKTYQGTLRK